MSKEEVEKLAKSVYFQVNERMSFIEPKDKIISILLFELGNLVQLKGEYENALQIYRTARLYGYDGDLIVARMINSAQGKAEYYREKTIEFGTKLKTLKETKKRIDSDYVDQIEVALIVLGVISIILVIGLLVFFIKWRNLKKSISVS